MLAPGRLAQVGSPPHPRDRAPLHVVQRPAVGTCHRLRRRLARGRPGRGARGSARLARRPALRCRALERRLDRGHRSGRDRTERTEHHRRRRDCIVRQRVVAAVGRRRRRHRVPAVCRRRAVRRPRSEPGDGREPSVRRARDDRRRRSRRRRQRLGTIDRDGHPRPVRWRGRAWDAAGRHDTTVDARRSSPSPRSARRR